MAVSKKWLEENAPVQTTARDKVVNVDLKITAIDNGIVTINGTPINGNASLAGGGGWTALNLAIAQVLDALHLAHAKRQNLCTDTVGTESTGGGNRTGCWVSLTLLADGVLSGC